LVTDLGAEKVITAEKGLKRIAVEVKSFITPSAIHEFIKATGQYRAYILAMRLKQNERVMYLAVPTFIWKKFLASKEVVQALILDQNIHLILYDPIEKSIDSWKE
jgi:XisH protein